MRYDVQCIILGTLKKGFAKPKRSVEFYSLFHYVRNGRQEEDACTSDNNCIQTCRVGQRYSFGQLMILSRMGRYSCPSNHLL